MRSVAVGDSCVMRVKSFVPVAVMRDIEFVRSCCLTGLVLSEHVCPRRATPPLFSWSFLLSPDCQPLVTCLVPCSYRKLNWTVHSTLCVFLWLLAGPIKSHALLKFCKVHEEEKSSLIFSLLTAARDSSS